MYVITTKGLGQGRPTVNCSGWEKDPQSFGKVIAEHYAATELGVTARGNPYWCSGDGKRCEVSFPGDITVIVSLVRVPDYVIAIQGYKKYGGPRREYTYSCKPNGQVVFKRR